MLLLTPPWGRPAITAPLVLLSCALLGFRHGFDYDHIAAITDIAGIESGAGRVARTMRLGLLYALGHAATVAVLGVAVLVLRLALPPALDLWAERLVGLTLILLAGYVLFTLVRTRGRGRPRSRAQLLGGAVRWFRRQRNPASAEINAPASFSLGILHGLGAETPSQLALFLLAAHLGGVERGLLGLACFLVGLIAMNSLMTAGAAGLFSAGRGWHGWYPLLTGLTASYSFGMGVVFLCGKSGLLKNISG